MLGCLTSIYMHMTFKIYSKEPRVLHSNKEVLTGHQRKHIAQSGSESSLKGHEVCTYMHRILH